MSFAWWARESMIWIQGIKAKMPETERILGIKLVAADWLSWLTCAGGRQMANYWLLCENFFSRVESSDKPKRRTSAWISISAWFDIVGATRFNSELFFSFCGWSSWFLFNSFQLALKHHSHKSTVGDFLLMLDDDGTTHNVLVLKLFSLIHTVPWIGLIIFWPVMFVSFSVCFTTWQLVCRIAELKRDSRQGG